MTSKDEDYAGIDGPRNPMDPASVALCTVCPHLGRDHVPAWGNPTADIAIVGSQPSEKDVEQGTPFTGDPGAMLDMALAVAEVNREDCYLTTALKCRPVIGRPGDLRELQQCAKTWLFQELTLVKPKIIVVLGREAHTALRLPKEQWGHVTLYTSARATYVIGYSPSYFLWSKRIDEFRPVGLLLRSAIDEHLKEAT